MKKASLPATGSATNITLTRKLPKKYDALVLPVFSTTNGITLAASDVLPRNSHAAIVDMLTAVGATGKFEEVTRIPAVKGVNANSIIAVGLGDANETDQLDDDTVRRAAAVAARSAKGLDTLATTLGDLGIQPTVEGSLLGAYHYAGLKTDHNNAPVKNIVVVAPNKSADTKESFHRGRIAAESVNLTRDLVNTPSSHLYPESYANIISDIAHHYGISVKVWDEKKLAQQGFGGILAVGMGSARKPRLVQLKYSPKKAITHVSFVGKGITFDTGGISLKPGANMDHMISDMGGSAAAVATVVAAARLELNIEVTATVALAENMPDGEAYRPGDVITHYGGTTTEILNTDAEGRLVLADALVLASEENPDFIIDTATLTGAQIVALGDRTSGVMGDDEFAATVATIGRNVGENAWAMPLPEELAEAVKSPVADLRNVTSSRSAGMLAAGCFLREFVGEGITWTHVDIAGPSFNTGSAYGYTPARATGVPVRTYIQLLREIQSRR